MTRQKDARAARRRPTLHVALCRLERAYFRDWDKLSQLERDAWDVVRAEAARCEELERRIEVATDCIRRISTGTVMGGASALAALAALSPRQPKRGGKR